MSPLPPALDRISVAVGIAPCRLMRAAHRGMPQCEFVFFVGIAFTSEPDPDSWWRDIGLCGFLWKLSCQIVPDTFFQAT
jgi:hypothetical protein